MTIDKACLETNVDEGWHKDFHLDELSGKGLEVAIEVRSQLDSILGGLNPSEYKVACSEHWDDETCPPPKDDCNKCQEVFLNDGCVSGCKLFKPSVSYVYSTGGYDDEVKYHTDECRGLFSMVYDGGILWDFLSYNGDAAYESPAMYWKIRQSLEKIASKHGCIIEDSTTYAMTFYEEG